MKWQSNQLIRKKYFNVGHSFQAVMVLDQTTIHRFQNRIWKFEHSKCFLGPCYVPSILCGTEEAREITSGFYCQRAHSLVVEAENK